MQRFCSEGARHHRPRQVSDAAVGDGFRMVGHPGRLPGQAARGLDLDRHIGEFHADGLMFNDVASTLPTHFGVVDRRLVGRTGDTDVDRRHLHYTASGDTGMEHAMRDVRGQHIVFRNLAVFECHRGHCAVVPARAFALGAECRQEFTNRQARRGPRQQQRQRAVTAGHLGLHHEQSGHRRIGDKRCIAADHPRLTIPCRRQFRRARRVGIQRHGLVVTPAQSGAGIARDQCNMKTVFALEQRQPACALRRTHRPAQHFPRQ